MGEIRSFKIDIPEEKLERLKKKLELTDLPNFEIEGKGWKYGTPVSRIRPLLSYWQTTYSWRATESQLNKLPHFKTLIDIDGFGEVDIHFIHQKAQGDVTGIPLLFVHGWPGSFLEVSKMIEGLTGGGDGGERMRFDVVALSLPGYCFSGGTRKPGFEIKQYAETCQKLMLRLGYNEYVTQGGDWGFIITRALAYLYPQSCKACHINWIFASPPSWTESNPEPEYSEREKVALARGQDWWVGDGRGYLAIQGTKPATIAFSHSDSPVAFLAWILEKLIGWSDNYPWTEEEILTWVCLYLFSEEGPEASSYHYYEALHGREITVGICQSYIDVPLGLADFPVEISNAPKSWWGTLGPVVWSKSYDKGGHFAGWERPDDIVDGLCEMFGKGGGAYGVVDGRDGY